MTKYNIFSQLSQSLDIIARHERGEDVSNVSQERHEFKCAECRKVLLLEPHVYEKAYKGQDHCLSCRGNVSQERLSETDKRMIEKYLSFYESTTLIGTSVRKLFDEYKRLQAIEQKADGYKATLEWYANKKNWQLGVTITMGSAFPLHEPIKSDKGERAMQALEGADTQ